MSENSTFDAVVLKELNKPLELIKGIQFPALKSGQALIKIFYAGLCHSQVMEARGHRGKDPYLPHMLGHEGTGEVVAVGDGVTKVAPGDYVVMTWIKGTGQEAGGCCYAGPSGETINSGGVTTFGEYAVVSENRLVRKPDGIPFDLGVLLGCALPTGAGIVLNDIKPAKGAKIAVIGLGGIGISALLAATTFDPTMLIAVDIEQSKLDLAREFGATHVFHASKDDWEAEILALTDGKGVDHAVEATGLAEMIERSFNVIRPGGGELVFASHPKAGDMIRLDPFELIKGKTIRGSWGGSSKPDRDLEILADLFRKGHLPLERLLSNTYTLQTINEALEDLENRKIIRALIKINEPPADAA